MPRPPCRRLGQRGWGVGGWGKRPARADRGRFAGRNAAPGACTWRGGERRREVQCPVSTRCGVGAARPSPGAARPSNGFRGPPAVNPSHRPAGAGCCPARRGCRGGGAAPRGVGLRGHKLSAARAPPRRGERCVTGGSGAAAAVRPSVRLSEEAFPPERGAVFVR